MLFKKITKSITGGGLLSSAAIYGLANAVSGAVPFLLMPVFTRVLSPEAYAYITLFTVFNAIAAVLIGLSLQSAVSRFFFMYSREEMGQHVASFAILVLWNATFYMIVWIIVFPLGLRFSGFPVSWLWTTIIIGLSQTLIQFRLVLWQVSDAPLQFGIFQVVSSAGLMALSVLFVVNFSLGWQGRILAQVFISTIMAIVVLFSLLRRGWLSRQWSLRHMRAGWKFSWPLIPHSLGGIAITLSDRIFVASFVGLSEAGVYAVAVQFGMAFDMMLVSFNQAWLPWLFKRLNADDLISKRGIVGFTYLLFAGILLTAWLFALILPLFLSFLVGSKFSGAKQYLLPVLLGAAFRGLYYLVSGYVYYSGKTLALTKATVFAGITSVTLCFYGTKWAGAYGAASSYLVSNFVFFIVVWWASARVFPMPWRSPSFRFS